MWVNPHNSNLDEILVPSQEGKRWDYAELDKELTRLEEKLKKLKQDLEERQQQYGGS